MSRGRILTDGERDYLKDRRVWPNRRLRGADWERSPPNRDVKHRIHHKGGRNLRRIVRDFRLDLHALEEYYKSERPEDWDEYSTITLPQAQEELEELRDLLDQLIQRADSDPQEYEKAEIRDALGELTTGLPHVQRAISNDFEAAKEAGVQWEGNEIVGPPEYLEEDEVFKERQKALMAVLSDEGLYEIFSWICDHRRDVHAESLIDGRTKSNSDETWKQAIGRYLVSKHELVAKRRWEYDLTDRGECVNRAIKSLVESEAVAERVSSGQDEKEEFDSALKEFKAELSVVPNVDERQAAVDLLTRHFSADQWI